MNVGLAKVVVQLGKVSVLAVAMATHQDTTIMESGRSCWPHQSERLDNGTIGRITCVDCVCIPLSCVTAVWDNVCSEWNVLWMKAWPLPLMHTQIHILSLVIELSVMCVQTWWLYGDVIWCQCMYHQSPPFVYCVVRDLITSGLLSTESCQLCSHTLVHKQHTHIQKTI